MRKSQKIYLVQFLFFACFIFFFWHSSSASALTLTAPSATSITTTSAHLRTTLSSDPTSGSCYIYYGTSPGKGYTSNVRIYEDGSVVLWGGTLTGFAPGTKYYVYAKYVDGSNNKFYSAESSFTTLSPTAPPSVSVQAVSNTGTTTATGNGNVTAVNGANPSSRIIQWGTSSGAYIGSCDAGAGGAGAFACTMSGLSPNTYYYVRACAYNTAGWGCSGETAVITATALSTVSTSSVTNVATTLALGNGYISATGGANPTNRLIYWGTSSGAWIGSCDAGAGGVGAYACWMTGLSPNTTYYVRAYAVNPAGWSWGGDTTFTTATAVPTVTTSSVTSIGTTTATASGNVTETGGATPSSRIVQWGTVSGTYTSSCNAGAGGTGAFTCAMTSLSPNTTYYVQACALNTAGWGCGAQTSFTTAIATATVTTQAVSDISFASATGNGTIIATGGNNPTRYIEWGTSSGAYTTGSCTANAGSTGAYTCSMTGLTPNTTYYVRAKAVNSAGTTYGDETSFTTAVTEPTVTTNAATAIMPTTATINANLTTTGGNNPTRYIEYGTQTGAYTQTCDMGISGIGAYSCDLTDLMPNAVYYYRAKVTNSAGTAYGSEVSFTTAVGAPSVVTQAASDITTTSATINASVTDIGGQNPTRYIEWGVATGVYTHSCDEGAGNVGAYACTLTGLDNNATYFYRAKVENTAGIAYGSEVSFTTDIALASVITNAASNITPTTATINANLTTTGGENPNRYVAWGTVSGDYAHTCHVGANAVGVYTCDLSDLAPNTTYYYKAHVTNTAGTTYGDEMSFTTAIAVPTITTEVATNLTTTKATIHANITVVGGQNSTRTILWGTSSDALTNVCDQGVGSVGQYACALTNLTPDTTYFFKAQAVNDGGTGQGEILSFTTQPIPAEVIIPDPNDNAIEDAADNAYFHVNEGTVDDTEEVTTNTTIKIITNNVEVVLPPNTNVREENDQAFDFTKFQTTNTTQEIKQQNKVSHAAVKVGVPDVRMEFSQPITITLFVGEAYNGREMQVLYREDAETTWHPHTTCIIANGNCVFTTDHTTVYTVNGDGTISGAGQNDITTDVQDILSMDCDQTGNVNDNIIEFGNLTPGTPVTASTTCAVTTNSDAGYVLAVRREDTDSTMDKDGDENTDITDRMNWDSTGTGNATTWNLNDTNLAFTVYNTTATKNTTWWGTGTTQTDTNNKYAGFPTVFANIMQHAEYNENATMTDIGYKLDVPSTQKSGVYSGEITYQVTTAP